MKIEGGCYCGAVRYQADDQALFKGECFCRECQYVAGGSANLVLGVPAESFTYTKGEPKGFSRSDLEHPVTREFCPECGTHLATRSPQMAAAVMVKVGTLDDPAVFGGPQMAIFTCDKQAYHHPTEGIPTFERLPG